ncbi:MAG TPA: hypothetical protein HA264_08575 [Methanolinea sp.]|jgi:uncharacterized ferredoxin-like protein|nr:MAG: hypothetical protein A4E36_00431 [Methanoregulaceae archaeon PtaB.Bin009]OPY38840.1 MAG: hypothetical protein A4E41_01855 [Methanoregulaceae archaeon PtaU1.Bin066]HII77065.1 hypothetical protein [Methanolinea sp.]HNQ28589.1 DUF2148 domain-containing protein [Methanolinea sp.]
MHAEDDGVMTVARLMALSARTAPKGKGKDSLVCVIAGPGDLAALAGEMERLSKSLGLSIFTRDAGNVSASQACLIIGVRGQEPVGINCQGCGFPSCDEMVEATGKVNGTAAPFRGPNCVIKITDLGIAVGSAVKTASIHNVDNRVMYTAGAAALSLGWLPACTIAYGIPLSASGKSIYFDRQK